MGAAPINAVTWASAAYLWVMRTDVESVHTVVFGPMVIERSFTSMGPMVSVVLKSSHEAAVADALAGTVDRERRGMSLQMVWAVRVPDDDLAYNLRSLSDLWGTAQDQVLDGRMCAVIAAIQADGEVLHA